MRLSEIRKAVVSGVGAGLTLLTSALDTFGPHLSGEVTNFLTAVVAVGTAVATYLVRNEVAEVIDRY